MEDIETKPNDMAFPLYRGGYADTGLTKREYFAAMAMQGILASKKDNYISDVVCEAVDCADALIEELNK